jgi:3-hydroxyisobutyrate dehydrogenase
MKTGFIGLGAMGGPMARNLHRAGHLVAVWNRTHEKAQALAKELDVTVADSPQALAGQCDLIITSVSTDDDLLEVVQALAPGLAPETVVVDTSTVSAATARRVAQLAEEAGAHFLDAPVSGGVEGARNATLVMMVGGDSEHLDRLKPVLQSMARSVVHMGSVGSGQAAKAVNQVMAAGINQAVTEALAFGDALGLDMDKLIAVLGAGAASNWFLTHRGRSMTQARFEPGFKLALHYKDLSICREMAESVAAAETRLPIVEMTLVHYRRLMEAGYGDEDISSLYRQKKKLFDK